MRRFLVLGLALLLIPACEDRSSPTAGEESPEIRTANLPAGAALEAKVNGRINDLFPQPQKSGAHELFGEIKDALDDGDTVRARGLASDLLQLAASTDLLDPEDATTAEAYSDLIDLLFQLVGLQPPEVEPELLDGTQDGDDGTVAIAVDGQDNLILTDSAFAGTFIPDDALSEDLVIVIERLTEDEQAGLPGGECLPTDLEQREGCYRFDRIPEGAFQDTVEVGVCHDGIPDEFQLHKFEAEEAGEGVVALPNVSFSALDCDDFSIARATGSPLPWRLARSAWGATGGRLLGWLGPRPLQAVDAGFGGATINFSRIGWARGLDVEVFSGDQQVGPAGQQLADDPTVEVRTAHADGSPAPVVGGTDVTFAVAGGGGTVAGGQQSATVATDGDGLASVPWAPGTDGANRLVASVPGDNVVFTATAVTNEIFLADFDDESVGGAPQDPVVGTWSSISEGAGTIRVDASRFGLSKPVVMDPNGGPDGQSMYGTVEGTPPSAGEFDVSWTMVSGDTVDMARLDVEDGSADRLATLRLDTGVGGGDIEASTGNGVVDTGLDWAPGQARSYRIRVDLDAGTYSLFIDGSAVTAVQDAPFNADLQDVDGLAVVQLLNFGPAEQVFVLDEIRVTPAP